MAIQTAVGQLWTSCNVTLFTRMNKMTLTDVRLVYSSRGGFASITFFVHQNGEAGIATSWSLNETPAQDRKGENS
jgi:hypothetical protein